MSDIVLTALDGTNPLGFMAALGVLDALTSQPQATGEFPPLLRWRNEGGWRAVVRGPAGADDLIAKLLSDLQTWRDEPALELKYVKAKDNGEDDNAKEAWDLKPPPQRYREYLLRLVSESRPDARRSVDIAAAFATDVAKDNSGNTKPTALHFTAGNQEFLRMVHDLIHGSGKVEGVNEADLREALFGPWTYSRPTPVLQWDGTSSRAYALRASDPSKEKKLGVPGADWLAFRGLTFFTCVPVGTRIQTTACFGGWKTGEMRWPLWGGWLSARAVRTVLALPEGELTASMRAARGISLVLASSIRRSDQGGYGSFAPSRVV